MAAEQLSTKDPDAADARVPAHAIDWPLFWTGFICVLAVAAAVIFAPDTSATVVNTCFQFITHKLRLLYTAGALATILFLLWLAIGRHGTVRLGRPDERPEYSLFSWASMLFCTGVGAGLIYWSCTEWAFYYTAPPFGMAPRSPQALEWAVSYGMFHWGFTGWAFYCLPAVAISYAYHVRGIPWLRLSVACEPVLGRYTNSMPGRAFDLIVMVGLLGSAATGLAFAIEIVAASISRLGVTHDSYGLKLSIAFLTMSTIAVSVYLGIDRGIRRLSNFNAVLALLLLVFVLAAGPTLFILKMSAVGASHMLINFLRMNAWTDPLGNGEFVADWTIFYWAWWIALGPFVGIFICKISRGRTLREMVFGVLGFGTLGCALYFMVLGNYALDLELHGIVPVVEAVLHDGQAAAIAVVIRELPGGAAVLGLFMLVTLVFAATTYDSASYTLASIATRRLPAEDHPAAWQRVFWAFMLGVLPAALLYLGGLKSLQTISIIVSLPLLPVFVLIAIALVKSLREDRRAA